MIIIKYFKKSLRYLLQIILKIRAKKALSLLCKKDGVVKLLGEALKEAVQNKITPDEKNWIDKIERLRRELNASQKSMTVVDYNYSISNKTSENDRVEHTTVGEVCSGGSMPFFWSFILFKLIRKLKPTTCLELGTCLGISASFQAAALKLNGCGTIQTMEGIQSIASLAEENFKTLNLDNINVISGRFQDTLNEVLNTAGKIDCAFIDGHHEEKATLDYFSQIMPFLSEKALVVFDDISWSSGMKKAWAKISSDKRVKITMDLHQIGLCIIDENIKKKERFKIPMI